MAICGSRRLGRRLRDIGGSKSQRNCAVGWQDARSLGSFRLEGLSKNNRLFGSVLNACWRWPCLIAVGGGRRALEGLGQLRELRLKVGDGVEHASELQQVELELPRGLERIGEAVKMNLEGLGELRELLLEPLHRFKGLCQLRKLDLKSTHRLKRMSESDQLLLEVLQRLQRACSRLSYPFDWFEHFGQRGELVLKRLGLLEDLGHCLHEL